MLYNVCDVRDVCDICLSWTHRGIWQCFQTLAVAIQNATEVLHSSMQHYQDRTHSSRPSSPVCVYVCVCDESKCKGVEEVNRS